MPASTTQPSVDAAQRSPYAMVYGGRTPKARTVLVYGNCQAPYLARMLATLDDLNDDYRFAAALCYALPGEARAPAIPDADMKDVALLIRQYEEAQHNPALEALTSRLPDGCPVISYPSFNMYCQWPFETTEPRNPHDPAYPMWKRYPLGDMLGLQIARSGLSGPLAVAAYMDLSQRKMPNLHVRLQRDIERMQRYDARSDVKLADYVLARFREEHLFWTSGHVSAPAMAELTRRVAEVARPVLGGSNERAVACLAAASHYGGMGEHQSPIHPVVAEVLGLKFWQADHAYLWQTQHWTLYEYVQRYIEYDMNW